MMADNFLHRIDNNDWNLFGLENINNSSLDEKKMVSTKWA